ncbi:uncharacterized protein LOC108135389 [Drosophila elegans]|uniref:uncharacterized protein LOC108135389 n=1 Tax=Drosophila elegans TaxID=30023 RepID=UPI0007E5DF04|nr:uncharacterized protein LOC108135389 [Drosophila elegans]
MPGINEFQKLCKSMFTDSMRIVCSATVPETLSQKYHNRLIRAEDPYTIFQMKSQNSSYLLVFSFLEINRCHTIQLNDLYAVSCQNEWNETKTWYFGFSHRMCYNYPMNLTTELREHCGAKGYDEDEQSGYYYTNHDLDADISLQGNADRLLASPLLVLWLIASLLVFAILRWKAG